MNTTVDNLVPHNLWQHFSNIIAIPHPSHHEEALKGYIRNFAAAHNVECDEDEVGNLLLSKGATVGCEQWQSVALQAHLDMVPQVEAGREFDFLSDPIEAVVDGEWLRANGTTLGADNGIGVAAALAILADDELRHGGIEVLLTINEEAGMEGAFGVREGWIKSNVMLNLDTEVEGELTIGCAGGLSLVATFEYECESPNVDGSVAVRLSIGGLKGGHSGIEIGEQRGNANKLLFRFLRLTKIDMQIAAIHGGTLNNAIPRDAYADIVVAAEDIDTLTEQLERYNAVLREEYRGVDDGVVLSLNEIDMPSEVVDEAAASCIVWSVAGCHDGVQRMSGEMEGLVETSSNLAIVDCEGGECRVELLLRSMMESTKIALADTIASVFELADGEVECTDGYPGWAPDVNSQLLATMSECYSELFGQQPHVKAVHAGLECGVIGDCYPNIEMISFGPTILSPHSPAECVEIASVAKFYKLLRYSIEKIAAK